MQTGCCELVKRNVEKLSIGLFRSDRRGAASWPRSRLLFFSIILQRNFQRGDTFLLFSSSPA